MNCFSEVSFKERFVVSFLANSLADQKHMPSAKTLEYIANEAWKVAIDFKSYVRNEDKTDEQLHVEIKRLENIIEDNDSHYRQELGSKQEEIDKLEDAFMYG